MPTIMTRTDRLSPSPPIRFKSGVQPVRSQWSTIQNVISRFDCFPDSASLGFGACRSGVSCTARH
jgi:hypothetical protein